MAEQRVSKKDREEAARIAKEHGVRVTVGKFTIDGREGAAANDDEAARVQDKFDAMGAKR